MWQGLNIATTITNLFNIIYIQLGACISIVVGQYLGAGELKKAKDADNKMIVFSVFCCALVAGVMLVIGRFFPQIYNTSEQIKELATSFIAVSALLCHFVPLVMLLILRCAPEEKRWSLFCLIRFLPGWL